MTLEKIKLRSFLYLPEEEPRKNDLSVNFDKRTICIKNRITFVTPLFLLSCLQRFETASSTDPICIIFNSCDGGDCIAAKYMYFVIRATIPPVIGIAKNFVDSAALVPFAACRERIAYYGTKFLFHTTETVPTKLPRLTVSVHAILGQNSKITDDEMYAMLTEGFGFSQTYLVRMLCEKETEISLTGKEANEAKKLGIVHLIIKGRP